MFLKHLGSKQKPGFDLLCCCFETIDRPLLLACFGVWVCIYICKLTGKLESCSFICVVIESWCPLTHCWSPCSHTAPSSPRRWDGPPPSGSASPTWWRPSRLPATVAERSHDPESPPKKQTTTFSEETQPPLANGLLASSRQNQQPLKFKMAVAAAGFLTLKLRLRLGTFCSGWKRMTYTLGM